MVKKYWVYNGSLEEEGNNFTDYEGKPLTREQLKDCFTEVVKLSDLETFGKSFIKTMKVKWKKKFTPKIGVINWNSMWEEIEDKLKQKLGI